MNKLILFIATSILFSQTYPQIGLVDNSINIFLFKNATIHVNPAKTLLKANLIVKDDKVYKIGKDVYIEGAVEIDCQGKHIYPGFIDLYHQVDIDTSLLSWTTKHWNKRIHPEYTPNISDKLTEESKKLREKGFVLSVLAPKEGIFRGS